MRSLIRFHCPCGKSLAAKEKYVGREATCPRCKRRVMVPGPPEPEDLPDPAAVSTEPAGPCRDRRLDAFYRAILSGRIDRIDGHEVEDGRPSIRFRLPDHRGQRFRLDLSEDGQLVVTSEIGTATSFEETVAALQLNRTVPRGRLCMDEGQLLYLEARVDATGLDDAALLALVDEIGESADGLEESLFGIDVR